jgi:ABC-type multidrug transport system ATPase subunit
MTSVAEELRFYLDNLSSVASVQLDVAEDSPEIHLFFDPQLMDQYGVSLDRVALELNTFQEEYTSQLKYKHGADEYDIIIRERDRREKTIDDLRELPVPAGSGGTHELENLSRIVYSYGMQGINRTNQEKQIEVHYQFAADVTSSKSLLEASRAEIEQLVANMKIPSGVAVEVIHEETPLREYFFLIGVSALLIYMILAAVFESLLAPVVIMFTIPLAGIGSFLLLIFTGTPLLNAYTLTGLLILLGVVVNNGIILIDFTRILRTRGYGRVRALMTAGQARLRPILITAITTVVGMIPLAMGKVEQATIIGAPFAVAVIGGLTVSALFTLVLIPVVYSGLERALGWMRGLHWRIRLIQLGLLCYGCWLIHARMERLVWKFAGLFALVMLIPAITYFVMSSLRRAGEECIRADEPITINVRNVFKIFDRDSRFIREWKKGRSESEAPAGGDSPGRLMIPESFTWQLPVLGFLIYFVYIYLGSSFWLFVLSHAVYFFALHVLRTVDTHVARGSTERAAGRGGNPIPLMRNLFLWGFPLFNLVLFYFRWRQKEPIALIAVAWYFSLIVYAVSERLQRERIDVNRLGGRFAGPRRRFYRFVQWMPLIGRRMNPFTALSGVSVEIGRGMFGLVGPNGAGKTTLMRIICGILDQSYGTIRINGIDISEKREELQGLIGYLPQEFGMYENMSAYEFLDYQAILKNIIDAKKRKKAVEYVLSAVHMEKHQNQKIRSFSGGMKQRIGIAQILLHLPRILVVDEPTAGLDPRERIRFRNLLVELSRERVVIFSTHIIEDISTSCNTVAVLDEGKIRYLGEPARMMRTAEGRVWQFYTAAADLESTLRTMPVVHHVRVGDRIRVRSLSEHKPCEEAVPVKPTLEDAYLWLLKREKRQASNHPATGANGSGAGGRGRERG